MSPTPVETAWYGGLRRFRWLAAPLFIGQHTALVEWLVRRYARRSERVLDLGARRSPYTAGLTGLVVGLDLPAEEEARLGFSPQSLRRFASGRRVAVFGRGERMPFPDASFDTVLMIEVIEHVEQDAEVLREVRRVLRPGGCLLLTTPNGATFPVPARYHLRHYTPEALRAAVGAELEIERLWQLFPDGRLWAESVRSVQKLLRRGDLLGLARHFLAVWVYWFWTFAWLLAGKGRGTTTLALVARKPGAPAGGPAAGAPYGNGR